MRKGENIFKRKDGRWEARYIKGYELSGKAKYGFCYGKSYKEAKEKVTKCKVAMLTGQATPQNGNRHRFGFYCDEWLRLRKSKVRESTYIKYHTALEKHIKPKLGGCFPSGITSGVADDFAQELLFEDELAVKTVHDILVVLHAADKKVKIKVYMRSLGAQDGSEELLSHMNLTVRQNGNSVLFEAPANETAQLTDWVYLGTVYSGGKIDLDVTVNVDPALDNRFQDAIGYLDWQFRVEELPVSPEDPKTGDAFDPMPWVFAAAGSLVMIAVLVAVFKRKAKTDGGAA